MTDKALRHNKGKLRWSLVDFKALEPLVQVLEFGAQKYAEDNWKLKMEIRTAIDSMLRHVIKLSDGELIDQESGLSHIGHIQANALFIQYHLNKGEQWPLQPTEVPSEVKAVEDCVIFNEDYTERRVGSTDVSMHFTKDIAYPIENDGYRKFITCPVTNKKVQLPIVFASYTIKECYGKD